MNLLLDTHLLLWAAAGSGRLSPGARALIGDAANRVAFSAASIWEVAIKAGLGRADFRADPARLRKGLLENGYREVPVTGAHALRVLDLPPLHRDPFDRLLVAQAAAERLVLVTADRAVGAYPGPEIRVV